MAHNNVEKTPYNDLEKDQASLKEDIHASSSSQDDYECEFTPAEQKKIIHRVDRRLVVTVGVLYCISLMDRTNLSAAAIAGYASRFCNLIEYRTNWCAV
jgi:hypothetical protein